MELSSDLREDNLLEVTVRNVKTVIKCKTALHSINKEGLNIIWREEEKEGWTEVIIKVFSSIAS